MNRFLQISSLFVVLSSLFALSSAVAQPNLTPVSISMNSGYADEIYYNMSTGVVSSVPRNQWDISFRTLVLSSSIQINDGAGVVLYTYPVADTSGWATLDTAGLYSWIPMYNDPADWENGAFCRYTLGNLDFGWGTYNVSTHDVVGDSLFVIKLRDGSLKKIWIERKNSVNNTYYFRYANIDGTNDQTQVINMNDHLDKEFIGFSLQTSEIIDFMPPKSDWDILFTKYMSVQPNGTPYPVIGVLSNPNIGTKRFAGVSTDYMEYNAGVWDSTRSNIGWDWKYFDMNSFTYLITDSLVFFALDQKSDIYKIVFTGFEGTSTGVITFNAGKVSSLGIRDRQAEMSVSLYPNPASDLLHVSFLPVSNDPATIGIRDLAGRIVISHSAQTFKGISNHTELNISGLTPGSYLLEILTGNAKSVQKLIIR